MVTLSDEQKCHTKVHCNIGWVADWLTMNGLDSTLVFFGFLVVSKDNPNHVIYMYMN